MAALDERLEATVDDIGAVIDMAVAHRMAKDPLEPMEANFFRAKAKFRQIFKPDEYDQVPDEGAVDDAPATSEEPAKPEEEEDKRAGMKAGAWAGPPGGGGSKDRGNLKPGQWSGPPGRR